MLLLFVMHDFSNERFFWKKKRKRNENSGPACRYMLGLHKNKSTLIILLHFCVTYESDGKKSLLRKGVDPESSPRIHTGKYGDGGSVGLHPGAPTVGKF